MILQIIQALIYYLYKKVKETVSKTKLMVINKKKHDAISIQNQKIEVEATQKEFYLYLGTRFLEEMNQTLEIQTRIRKANSVLLSMKFYKNRSRAGLTNENDSQLRVLGTLVEALEMYVYRRMLKIS